jgi:ribonuclease-3
VILDYAALESRLGYSFLDKQLLVDALTHSSYAYEQNVAVQDNQRLEFLGDAVLQLVVTEHFYRTLSDTAEGEMTKLRSGVVCEPTLVLVAHSLGLGSFLRLGHGESLAGGNENPSNLSDAVEAVLGAIFFEGGYGAVREVVLRLFEPYFELALEGRLIYDYKSRLYEWAQAKGDNVISFTVLEESGPPHDKTFRVGLWINDVLSAEGCGQSKKAAEQQASRVFFNSRNRSDS